MSELDQVLLEDLKTAIELAREENRFSLGDYLTLKESNDAVREKSVRWLVETILEIVFAFNNHGANIGLTQNDNHRFKFGNSNLRGSLVKLQQGVRCLTLEAGWTRTPSDGFMRGGALACAKISHFGFARMNEELVLLKYEDIPQWFSVLDERNRASFDIRSFRKHFETFLGDR
jgi:hypothetical protein